MKSSDTQMELVRRYLGGEATLEEAQRLESMLAVDAQLRRDYLAYARVEAGLSSKVRPKLVETSPPNRWLSWRPLAAAAAILILVALGWLSWLSSGTVDTALVIASADSTVQVERAGETMRLPLGTMLIEGDVVVSEGTSIVVSYPEEETRIELAPGTRLEVLRHREGKRLRLHAGTLSAEVAPQPEGRPMRLFTLDAEAVVLGTRFTLNAEATKQELAVQKGAVRVNRATMADSIVVSAEEKVRLSAKALELEPLPPALPPRWRDEHTLALDFETDVTWPLLRAGRVVVSPQESGHCLAAELVEVVRRHGDRLVLATSLRPQCILSADSRLQLRCWAASGIEGIEVFLYVFGVERAFKAELKPEANDRWVDCSFAFAEFKSAAGAPPASNAQVRSISVHTSPVSGPLAFFVDDVVLENVSALPPLTR